MAGENSLPTQYYRDDQQLVCEVLPTAPTTRVPILYADRNLIIDSIVVGTLVASTGDTTATIQKTTAGTNDGITITPAAPNATLTSMMATGNIATGTIGTIVVSTESATRSLSNSQNTLDAGNWMFYVPGGTATSHVATIQIRFRSRPK
jgi:hypothetical protein